MNHPIRSSTTFSRKIRLSKLFLFACMILIPLGFILLSQRGTLRMSFKNPFLYFVSRRLNAQLDHNSFDIVLSYYKEDPKFVARFIQYLRDVSTLRRLNARVIIYNKNRNVSDEALKRILKADWVQSLPNLGREGATYLTHIINNYDTIADHTLFCQAGVEGITNTGLADWFKDRLEKQFTPRVGYMPLVVEKMITKSKCGYQSFGDFPRYGELWGILQHTLCPLDGQAVSFRGQFLVSAKRIRQRPLHIYQYLNDLITANATHWIHRDPRMPKWKSTPDNPVFGHLIERSWTLLFNCTELDLLQRCRENKCACYD